MPKAKYHLEDFLAIVSDDGKEFVTAVHEMLTQAGYKPKIQVTKSTGTQLAYHQPKIKSVAGIVCIFFVLNNRPTIRMCGTNHKAYPDVLNSLPERLVSQIDAAANCIKFADPERCWKGCMGYDLHINGKHYQKCIVQCFQFDVEPDTMPYLIELIQRESQERMMSTI